MEFFCGRLVDKNYVAFICDSDGVSILPGVVVHQVSIYGMRIVALRVLLLWNEGKPKFYLLERALGSQDPDFFLIVLENNVCGDFFWHNVDLDFRLIDAQIRII